MYDDVNRQDQYGMTPLHLAASKGDVRGVEELLNNGANPNIENNNKQMPISSALSVSALDYQNQELRSQKEIIFQMLYSQSPSSAIHKDNNGESILHLLTRANFPNLLSAILNDDSEGLLLQNNRSQYPIHTAFLNLNEESKVKNLTIILEHSKNINIDELVDSQLRTPLHYAAKYGTKKMIECCISATSNINKADTSGKTPLMSAAIAGNNEAITALINKGAEESLIDCDGLTYEDYIRENQISKTSFR